jgi:hypothetical protein
VRRPDDLQVRSDPAAQITGMMLLLMVSPVGLAVVGLAAGHAVLRWGRVRPWMLAAGGAGLVGLVVLVAGGPAIVLVHHVADVAVWVHDPRRHCACRAGAHRRRQANHGPGLPGRHYRVHPAGADQRFRVQPRVRGPGHPHHRLPNWQGPAVRRWKHHRPGVLGARADRRPGDGRSRSRPTATGWTITWVTASHTSPGTLNTPYTTHLSVVCANP